MTKITSEETANLIVRKAQYIAAKLELIFLCENCGNEIYKPPGYQKWHHKDAFGIGRVPCFNDELDGTA